MGRIFRTIGDFYTAHLRPATVDLITIVSGIATHYGKCCAQPACDYFEQRFERFQYPAKNLISELQPVATCLTVIDKL